MLTTPQNKTSGYVRDGLDWYVEPSWCVDVLLDALALPAGTTVLDPACGMGTIPEACNARGICAVGSDIADRGYGFTGRDFLARDVPLFPDAIITNPPYGKASEFVREARWLANKLVAVLIRLDFLASKTRHILFRATPPARVLVLSKRPSMPPGQALIDGTAKRGGGQHDFCWIVWDRERSGPTEIEWLLPDDGGAA